MPKPFFRRLVLKASQVGITLLIAASLLDPASLTAADEPLQRPRIRDLGITIGILPTGQLNAITDVAGVRVGHRSVINGDRVRTGVTAVIPHSGNLFQAKVPAAVHVANGFGKFVGSTQVNELGVLETPILMTNTLSTFTVADAVIGWTLRQEGNEDVLSVNPVVGECNDGYLNDIRGGHVRAEDVLQAIDDAKGGVVGEGCVGAGVGTRCLGWKGGIGTSSRKLPAQLGGYTIGVLVQSNFAGQLTIGGAPVGRSLGRFFLQDAVVDQEHGSCIVVVATDAPLDARQLQRLAKRASLGLAAVGSPITHGSGDYVVAFSTDKTLRQSDESDQPLETTTVLRDDRLSPLFQGVREATEEAVVNSLLKATTTAGRDGRIVEAIDPSEVERICRKFGLVATDDESAQAGFGIDSAERWICSVKDRIPTLQQAFNVPGVAVAVIDQGQLVWSDGFGVRCKGSDDPMTSDTVMEACSMSKPFFSYMVLKLTEQGEFDLDRPLVEYLGRDYLDNAPEHRTITARMAMTHTTGLPNWRAGGWRANGPMQLRFKPGTQFGYSGEGFLMLQRAVEQQTGEGLSVWSQTRLIKPLGLLATDFQWNESLAVNSACGHDRAGNVIPNRVHYDRACAAFTLYTTADDYARFLIEIMSSDRTRKHSISAEMVEQMLRPASFHQQQDASWGLGWGLKQLAGHRLAYHSGSNGSGFRCYCEFWPHKRDGIVIMTNAMGGEKLWPKLIDQLHGATATE